MAKLIRGYYKDGVWHKYGDKLYTTTGQNVDGSMTQKAVTDEIMKNVYNRTDVAIPLKKDKVPGNNGKWNMSSGNYHYQIPVTGGKLYEIKASESGYANIWWCTSAATPATNQYIPFCQGESSNIVIAAGNVKRLTAPSDAHYMYAYALTNNYVEYVKEVETTTTALAKIEDDVFSLKYIMSPAVQAPYYNDKLVKASNGTYSDTLSGYGGTNYIETKGAKKLYISIPTMGSGTYGIAFYNRLDYTTYISGDTFRWTSRDNAYIMKMYDVPEGANYFKFTIRNTGDTPFFHYVVDATDLIDVYKQSAEAMIATQIIRSAIPVSLEAYKYAFGMSQLYIIDNKAYVHYAGNRTSVDGDSISAVNEACCAVVNLFDLSFETLNPTRGTTKYSDDTIANPIAVAYTTKIPAPDGSVASLALMRFNDNNPYYCYAFVDPTEQVSNWKTCRLQYSAGGTDYDVDFNINNYRQMIYRLGYVDSYVTSAADAVDNINLHYDSDNEIYYAVITTSQNNEMPLVLMSSEDMATWEPVANLGCASYKAGEISAIYKGGIAYVAYRTFDNGMRYIVYDVTNSTVLSEGAFPVSKDLLSKPDTFTFGNGVYMAVNVDPSAYGGVVGYNSLYLDARDEIAIYKIVDGAPKFFRRISNPTGIQYFSFMETPPEYATSSSTTPMRYHGAIYLAFSEDRRHLYRRQIGQMSFVDATALFVDSNRII